VFANDKYETVAVYANGVWTLESEALCGGDGDSATGAVSEALVWSTSLGLRVAYSFQQSTRSRKPY